MGLLFLSMAGIRLLFPSEILAIPQADALIVSGPTVSKF